LIRSLPLTYLASYRLSRSTSRVVKISPNFVGFAYNCLVFFTAYCLQFITTSYPSDEYGISETGTLVAVFIAHEVLS
jgi:hypothetical protein